MFKNGWLQDPKTQNTKRFHRDEKSWFRYPKVFIDSGRPLPNNHALLRSRSHVALQAAQDFQYKKDLEKAMMVKETTQKLPEEMGREIQKCLMGTSYYQNDIDFIAPDNVEPTKEIADISL